MEGIYVVAMCMAAAANEWKGLGGGAPASAHEVPGDGDNTLAEIGTQGLEKRRAQVCSAWSAPCLSL